MTEKMFLNAVRNKVRFPYKGNSTVEDLWDLTPEVLNDIYGKLGVLLDNATKNSLLVVSTKENVEIQEKMEIVKYIVITKMKEIQEQKDTVSKNLRKKRLVEVLKAKKDNKVNDMTIEEIEAMIENDNY